MEGYPTPEINYLRMSVTDRCNLRCFYCTYWQDWEKLAAAEILRYEELLRIAGVAARLGIRKIRITGGEPLVRRGLPKFIRSLRRIPGIDEICLTTNGTLLAELAPALFEAGLRRLNVSLDTLIPGRYLQITGRDNLADVLRGLECAAALGFHSIKINCVVLKGINDDELLDLALLARDHPLQVRFIELMPTASPREWKRRFLPAAEVRRRLRALGELAEMASSVTSGPARIFKVQGFVGEVGFISPMSEHRCGSCNRLRLTAQGRLRPCLLAEDEIDIKEAMRRGCADPELASLFREAMQSKHRGGASAGESRAAAHPSMAAIGG
ncbi:MAG: GTP 3',8-cyclase MoaA [Deltaproteobacteria bacterium]|nr:GTP 3',8-cyclase MoaA [Deltaproteobacteria bacterium]